MLDLRQDVRYGLVSHHLIWSLFVAARELSDTHHLDVLRRVHVSPVRLRARSHVAARTEHCVAAKKPEETSGVFFRLAPERIRMIPLRCI